MAGRTTLNTIHCPVCRASITPSAVRCHACKRPLTPNMGTTRSDASAVDTSAPTSPRPSVPTQTEPASGELPPYSRLLDIALLCATLVGICSILAFHHPANESTLAQRYLAECGRARRDRHEWRSDEGSPTSDPNVVLALPGGDRFLAECLDALGLSAEQLPDVVNTDVDDGSVFSERVRRTAERGPTTSLAVLLRPSMVNVELRSYRRWQGTPAIAFACRREAGWARFHGARLAMIGFTLLVAVSARLGRIHWYRYRRNVDWRRHQKSIAERLARARDLVDDAGHRYQDGHASTALERIRDALEIAPEFDDALQLRAEILSADRPLSLATAAARRHMYFRILGHPHAFEAPAEATTVRLGRERTCEVVVRIAGDDRGSLRISRLHAEVLRVGDACVIRCVGRNSLVVNGRRMKTGESSVLRPLDHIVIAGLIGLEFSLRDAPLLGRRQRSLRLASGQESIEVESTIGDLVTIEEDQVER